MLLRMNPTKLENISAPAVMIDFLRTIVSAQKAGTCIGYRLK